MDWDLLIFSKGRNAKIAVYPLGLGKDRDLSFIFTHYLRKLEQVKSIEIFIIFCPTLKGEIMKISDFSLRDKNVFFPALKKFRR